jgi:hypothetical protein
MFDHYLKRLHWKESFMKLNIKKSSIITAIVAVVVGGFLGVASRELLGLDGGIVGGVTAGLILFITPLFTRKKSGNEDDNK